MKTLHLNLKRKWFDMILIREKKEEYREIKPSFCSKFLLVFGGHRKPSWWKKYIKDNGTYKIKESVLAGIMTWKEYDTVTFVNGMTPPIPEFEIEHKGIFIGFGREDWGACHNTVYFVIRLGVKIRVKNTSINASVNPKQ